MNFPKLNIPIQPNLNRPPFPMPNMQANLMNIMTRPPYMNMNPQFMNQNPYMYMNFIRGQIPMPIPAMNQPNNQSFGNQMESSNK